MKKLLFIYNPHAGKGQIRAKLADVLDIFTKAGWLVTVRPTQGKSDATYTAARLGSAFDRGGPAAAETAPFTRWSPACGDGTPARAGLHPRRHHQRLLPQPEAAQGGTMPWPATAAEGIPRPGGHRPVQ